MKKENLSQPARLPSVLARNTAHVNETMAKILAHCAAVILAMAVLSAVGFFEFGAVYTWILVGVGLPVCLLPWFLLRVLPDRVMKYLMMVSTALFIGIIGADKNIGVYITYILVPLLSCLYFEPGFVLRSSAICYVVMLLSLYAGSAELPEVAIQGRDRVQMFFAYAAGFTMEYGIVAWVLSYLVKRANRLLTECVNAEKALAEAEKEKQAQEAKTTFLLNMSHDIRTPMNAILGYSRLMREHLQDPELLRYQEMIQQSGDLLLSIINNVLDMARIESGKMELDENYDQVGGIAETVCSVFEAEAKRKNLTMTYSVDVIHNHIMCDKTKLQELLTNLVSNAVKYTPEGGSVSVMIRELPSEKPGYVCLRTEVADTGIGMSPEFLPHLFDSFSRERNTTAGKVAGSGLGMAIVKSLVELMGGTITVESTVGKGTTFTVTLFHKLADEAYYTRQERIEAVHRADFSGKRILLAEDNDLNAEIATAILGEMGFAVDRAEDGIVCVDKLEHSPENTYDVVLMDIQMPNMDGYKAVQVIRHMPDSAKAGIPIIAMTANAFEEDRKAALEAGMNDHITKPIDVEKLREVLARVISTT